MDKSEWVKAFRAALPAESLQEDCPMSSCTTLRLGGPADLLADPASEDELRRMLALAAEYGLPVTVIGRGSNLLVRDGGIRGLVIRVGPRMKGIRRDGTDLTAMAGTTLSELAHAAAAEGLEGLAFASGIPGTAGGGVIMNAGAYGGELSQTVTLVEGLRMNGDPFRYDNAEMRFGYRESRLQHEDGIVTRVRVSLRPGDPDAIRAAMQELSVKRSEKQPLQQPSAGSTFKRPEGYFAAALIDQCGLKGARIGGAAVSEKHAGFLVNLGGTAADFEALMRHVQTAVYERFGVRLEPEVRILGEA